jgi:hypothetical protein
MGRLTDYLAATCRISKEKSSFNGAEALDDWLRSTLEMGCSGIDRCREEANEGGSLLNGEANKVRTKQSSAIIAADV